ncbi:MAG TPA: OpgC family protein [Sinorhizobium sp.]|nr:OpgC family protein [Sinorhizobium sp.]
MLHKTFEGGRERIRAARPVPTARDTRLDVFRALCLLTIFVNHVPGQYLEYLTHKNIGFSDSAEAFVLISGLAVGAAYGGKFVAGARMVLTLKAWRRALTLYVAHIMTSIVTLAIFSAGALYFGRQELIGEINIRPIVEQTEQGIVAMVLLGHQLGYNNILSMYAVLLLMLPGMLWLNAISPRLLLALSAALWLAAGCFKLVPSNFLDEGYWFLNPWSWQFLFVIGFLCMNHVRAGGRLPRSPWLIGLSAVYLAISACWVLFSWWSIDISFGLPAVLTGFDKTFLSLTRLLHVLALAYLLTVIPGVSRLTRLDVNHPLVMIGRHSLAVFIFGTILAMAGQVLLFVTDKDAIVGSLYVIAGIGLHFVYAHYLEWLKEMSKARPLQVA